MIILGSIIGVIIVITCICGCIESCYYMKCEKEIKMKKCNCECKKD